jgi:hypothetical protein
MKFDFLVNVFGSVGMSVLLSINKNISLIVSSLCIPFIFFSCAKTEGEGGQARIEGYVRSIDYSNKDLATLDTFPAVEEEVYILYGSGKKVSNKAITSHDGYYSFDYLRAGEYTLLYYGKDPEIN